MGKITDSEYDGALKIVRRYYLRLVKQLADESIQNRGDFDAATDKKADDFLEMYYHKLNHVSTILAHLSQFIKKEKPEAAEPLAAGEFRCFQCGKRIAQSDETCPTCGWSWKCG